MLLSTISKFGDATVGLLIFFPINQSVPGFEPINIYDEYAVDTLLTNLAITPSEPTPYACLTNCAAAVLVDPPSTSNVYIMLLDFPIPNFANV